MILTLDGYSFSTKDIHVVTSVTKFTDGENKGQYGFVVVLAYEGTSFHVVGHYATMEKAKEVRTRLVQKWRTSE